jgi:hypothetical protein
MNWQQTQESLWRKWRQSSPELKNRELWEKYKHEWVEAYRPFVKVSDEKPPKWLRDFTY